MKKLICFLFISIVLSSCVKDDYDLEPKEYIGQWYSEQESLEVDITSENFTFLFGDTSMVFNYFVEDENSTVTAPYVYLISSNNDTTKHQWFIGKRNIHIGKKYLNIRNLYRIGIPGPLDYSFTYFEKVN